MPYNKKIDPKKIIKRSLNQEDPHERKPETEFDKRIARLQEMSGGLYGDDKEQSAKMVKEANEAMKKRRFKKLRESLNKE